ncbi:uL13 family ribosomal protein [Candidatus Kaiserbacteria bacterium]|nr:uL13 family ribosomal protein [Candidatus Kaiserbacteria bacterium]
MTTTETRQHTIDATGKRLGKVATEAASVLMGKDQATFAKHIIENVHVTIENASKLDIPEGKKGEIYQSYSGYPGGRRTETLEHLGERLGYAEVVRRTVGGMLPNNKHKKRLLTQLTITE